MKNLHRLPDHQPIQATTVKIIAAFAVIYLVWGSTYLAIRLAINTLPPFLMAGCRFTIAGVLLYAWCYGRQEIKPTAADWKKCAIAGILMVSLGNGSVTWAEQYIPSGYVALMVATVPIWMVILDWFISKRKKPGKLTVAGMIFGFGGVALLSGINKSLLTDQLKIIDSMIPVVSILMLASLSWAAGSLYSRYMKTSVSLQFTISMQVILGGLCLILFGLLRGEWTLLVTAEISLSSLSALSYLILIGTILAYSAYVWLLRVSTPGKVGTYAFFNPLVAIFLGWVWVGEPVTIHSIIGSGCILLSILLVNKPKLAMKSLKNLDNFKNIHHLKSGGTEHDCSNLAGNCTGIKI